MKKITLLFASLFTSTAWAETPAGAAPGLGSMLLPFALMFAVVYFLMIRPQQKRMKEHQKMLTELKQGDEIVTASGMLGTVRGINDKVVTVEVADDVKVKMLKSQVAQVVKGQIQELPQQMR